jgi:hypothetical protein
MKKINSIVFLCCSIIFSINCYSQSGMRFSEFEKKIEKYFHTDLIADIPKEIGRIDFTV